VKDDPIDVLLMSHEAFETYKLTNTIRRNNSTSSQGKEPNSFVKIKKEGVFAMTKDRFKIEGREAVVMNNVGFLPRASGRIKLVRLTQGVNFYITHPVKKDEAIKIIMDDEREAILLSTSELYSEVNTPFERFLGNFIFGIFLLLVVGTMVYIYADSGWFVFIGIIFIPIGLFLSYVIGMPLAMLIHQITKRF
jgi:hypothetical protein